MSDKKELLNISNQIYNDLKEFEINRAPYDDCENLILKFERLSKQLDKYLGIKRPLHIPALKRYNI